MISGVPKYSVSLENYSGFYVFFQIFRKYKCVDKFLVDKFGGIREKTGIWIFLYLIIVQDSQINYSLNLTIQTDDIKITEKSIHISIHFMSP